MSRHLTPARPLATLASAAVVWLGSALPLVADCKAEWGGTPESAPLLSSYIHTCSASGQLTWRTINSSLSQPRETWRQRAHSPTKPQPSSHKSSADSTQQPRFCTKPKSMNHSQVVESRRAEYLVPLCEYRVSEAVRKL
ncbi:hypothetical protein O3P69_014762 [Scylla paramamosain]|uniref:Uncharacterized protein n=1 Tax=Scylla paramamosain TaxID=85552 RepID=A0AAW0TXS7_SCYPA